MTEVHGDAAVADQTDAQRSLASRRLGLTDIDLVVLLTLTGCILAFAPSLFFAGWTPRVASLLAVFPLGVFCWALLIRHRDLGAWLALALLVWSGLSAVSGGGPKSAFVGTVGRDLSTLTLLLSFGLWAAARRVSDKGRRVAVWTILGLLTTSSSVGIVQFVLGLDTGSLALVYGRATAFATNPVYFGALAAAGAGIAVAQTSGNYKVLASLAMLNSVAVSLSGSRVALLALSVVAVGPLLLNRSVAQLVRSLSVAVGIVLGGLLDSVSGAGGSATARLGSEAGGGRLTVWRYALDAWLEKPAAGWGLGRFRPAVQSRFSADFVRDFAPNETTQAWFDAHNVMLNLLVSVGVVGLVLALLFFLNEMRFARGPLVWGVVAILLTWMLQPVALVTLPVVLAALAIARPTDTDAATGHEDSLPAEGQSSRLEKTYLLGATLSAVLVVAGLLMAVYVVAADVLLKQAADDLDGARAARVSSMYVVEDAVVSDIVAQVFKNDESASHRESEVLVWRDKAATAESDRPYWWSLLAREQARVDDVSGAVESIERARNLQPYNRFTTSVEIYVRAIAQDRDALDRALEAACLLDMDDCLLDADQLLDGARAQG